MTEREQIDDILYDFFTLLINNEVPIIFENENGVRPLAPFISIGYNAVNFLGTIPYFKERMVKENEKEYETSIQPVERSCTLRAFGKNSECYLNKIKDLLHFDFYVDELKKKEVVIKNITAINEGSSVLSEDEETFYYMDFTVGYNRITQVENSYIEKVEIVDNGFNSPN